MSSDFEYEFIIDTDSYAGNFEREMCAYMTGETSDYEVASEEAARFREETGFEEDHFLALIRREQDEGSSKPCGITNYAGGSCNSVVIFLEDEPTSEEIALFKERAHKFCLAYPEAGGLKKAGVPIQVLGFRLTEIETIRRTERI